MEPDLREVRLRHLEDIARVGEEDIPILHILGHILVLTLLEGIQRLRIVALDPASLVEVDRLPATLRVVLMQQAVLDDLELELSDRTDDLATVELVGEDLGNTLAHQLFDTLCQLFRLHRVIILYVFEHLRREARQTLEVDGLAGSERVADLERSARVWKTHDIARSSLVDRLLLLRHEASRSREFHHLIEAHMLVVDIALELA